MTFTSIRTLCSAEGNGGGGGGGLNKTILNLIVHLEFLCP